MCFTFCSCGNDDSKKPKLVIAEQYQIATDYKQIEPLLKEYFTIIEEAYNNSDKQNIETFILPDRYNEVDTALDNLQNSTDMSNIISGGDEAMIAYQKKLALLQPYLKIELKIAEKNLLGTAGNSSNKEWFNSLSSTLTEAYEHYSSIDE